MFAVFAQSWNLLAGYAGQPSLGQALFLGMGAYTTGLLALYVDYFKTNLWLTIFAGAVVSSLIGLALGVICFRLRGPYFALATIAGMEIVRLSILYSEFTRGGYGIIIPVPPPITTSLFTIDFVEKIPFYYIALVIAIVSYAIVYFISKSGYGLMLQSIKEDEEAASSLGVNPFRLKLFVMAISGFICGIMGAFYAIYIGFIDPNMEAGGVLSLFTSIDAIIMTIIGGVGTIFGPFIGSLLKIALGEYLRVSFGWRAGVDIVIFGIFFIIIYLFAPKGIWGTLKLKYKKFSIKKLASDLKLQEQ
jgi:branched-chain amino acid transport system permease protein